MKKVFNGVNFGMEKYLRETKMLDYSSKNIQRLIQERNWNDIEVFERLKSIYNFVRDEILFGYNIDDNISASKVLADGYGQCNTKGTLFMALLRACNIPCRVHGFTIDKKLQKGAMTGIVYKNAPVQWLFFLCNFLKYSISRIYASNSYHLSSKFTSTQL